ncbi:MAG: paraquat-inducible protein A [Pseudomonadota bacterium]
MNNALKLINLSLLILYPIAWTAPLARAGLLPFFTGEELTIFGGVRDLIHTDWALAILVAFFAVIAPYSKVIFLSVIQFGLLPGERWMTVLEFMGRLSMADVFLIALYIVVVKGVGLGHVETAWGLYFFTALVLTSLVVAILTPRSVSAKVE